MRLLGRIQNWSEIFQDNLRQKRCFCRRQRGIQDLERFIPRTWQVRVLLNTGVGEGGKRCKLCQQPIDLKYVQTSLLIARLFYIVEFLFAIVPVEALTPGAAVKISLTSAPKHPDDPSAPQRDKRDVLPPEPPETPNMRARFCASLASCISYLRFTSISGNNKWKIATEVSSMVLG